MRLYSGTVEEFARDVTNDRLLSLMQQSFARQMLYRPSPTEVTSWANSLPVLKEDLLEAELSNAGIILESMLPLSSKRLDAVVLGRNSEGQAGAVVVELKQWRRADIHGVDERLVNLGNRLILHPQQQVAQYVQYLRDFHTLVDRHLITIDGGAYLHNADRSDAAAMSLSNLSDLAEFPLFTRDDRDPLRAFLVERASSGGGRSVLGDYLNAPMRPSKKLLDHVALEIDGQPMFHLLDEQLVAFELVRKAVAESRTTAGKTVVLVTGGPGTGKSVIAARIVGDAAQRGFIVSHATGSRSFTETLRKTVGRRAGQIFRYFNSFKTADPDELDVLVCDEAHRIRSSSDDRFTRRSERSGLPQIDELIQVAKVPVFLLDQNQVVRPQEIGTVEVIKDSARRNGAEVIQIDLNGQFRCMGSEGYVQWVERLLGMLPGGPVPWDEDEQFDLVVVDGPAAMERWLQVGHGRRRSARIAAGYCWPWSDPTSEGMLVDDVVIGEWRRPWNAKPGKKAKDVPAASYWATDPRGFGQVGCIYTAQGFEYDYGGVIIGPDLLWRDGKWIFDKGGHADPVTRRATNFDDLVRNIYKVLLTRAMEGCAICSTDEATQDLLEQLIPRRA